MQVLQQIVFIAIAAFAILLFTRNIRIIRRNILLGKDENLTDNATLRWKNLLLLAFGQKKMFRNPLVSPDILGVSTGAALGAVLGIFLGLSVLSIQLLAFAGGLAAVGVSVIVFVVPTVKGERGA